MASSYGNGLTDFKRVLDLWWRVQPWMITEEALNSTKLYFANADSKVARLTNTNPSSASLEILPVEIKSNLRGRPYNKNDVTKSLSLVTTTRLSRTDRVE